MYVSPGPLAGMESLTVRNVDLIRMNRVTRGASINVRYKILILTVIVWRRIAGNLDVCFERGRQIGTGVLAGTGIRLIVWLEESQRRRRPPRISMLTVHKLRISISEP